MIEQMEIFKDVLGIDFQANNQYDPKLELARLFKYHYYEAGEQLRVGGAEQQKFFFLLHGKVVVSFPSNNKGGRKIPSRAKTNLSLDSKSAFITQNGEVMKSSRNRQASTAEAAGLNEHLQNAGLARKTMVAMRRSSSKPMNRAEKSKGSREHLNFAP